MRILFIDFELFNLSQGPIFVSLKKGFFLSPDSFLLTFFVPRDDIKVCTQDCRELRNNDGTATGTSRKKVDLSCFNHVHHSSINILFVKCSIIS